MTPPPTSNIIGPGEFGCRKFRVTILIDKDTEEIKSEKEVRELIQKRIIQLEQEIKQLRLISDTNHKLHNQDKAFP